MSDATVLRTTVLPLSVEMHRALLVGPPLAAKTSKGDAKAKQAAKRASEALGTLISDLLEGYLDIQEAKISEIVAAYLSPLHPSVFHATTTNKWGQEEGSGESRRPKLLTEGLHSIYAHLLKVHTQVFAFAPPMTMRPVWDTMVQCLASELVAGYAGLEVGSTSMDRCMDLLLDLCYLECMWSPLATGQRGKRPTAKGRKEKEGPLSASGHFEASFMALGEVMLAVASSRLLANKGRTGSFSPLERMFQGLPNPASVINRGRDLFGDGLLESIVEENGSLNSKLFSSI